ncbi:MAG: MinD/ParA family protein [Deltaproteobacteria bacterium]|nr:MinD/ParA family protein [Deltaproteobacteria bacterium]
MDQAENLRTLVNRSPNKSLRVIAVTSGKGGVGKTNISANLAVLAARAGRKVLILDADLGLANVEILYGLKPRLHMGHLLDASADISEVMAVGPHGVRVLPAGSGIQGLTRLDDAQKLRLMTALDYIEDAFDLVIVDSSAGIGDNVLFFVGGAQEALLVVTVEPTSLTDAYAAVKVLSQQAGVHHFNVVVNTAPTETAAREIFETLTSVTSRFLNAKVKYLGYLPRDENMHRAIMAQRPLVDLFPQSPSSRALALLADKLFNEAAPVSLDGGMKFLWQRLLREQSPTG